MRSVRPALYAGITTTTFGPCAPGSTSVATVRVEPAPTGLQQQVDALGRQGPHAAPSRPDPGHADEAAATAPRPRPGADHEKGAAAPRPRRLEPLGVPERVPRVRERRAEREVRLQPVD